MAVKENYLRYIEAMDGASILARRELEALWSRLDVTDARGTRNLLIELLPGIVRKYSDMAAAATAEYYEAERRAWIPEDYTAILAEPVPDEQIEASVRYAVRHLFGEEPDDES